MKQHKHLGCYGIIIKDNKILLIKKVSGPYDGKLDLPGGTIEFEETPEETLKREIKEEVGIEVKEYELLDCNSIIVDWLHKGENIKIHHIGIFYKVINYEGIIKNSIDIDSRNDDSMGAEFYDINNLQKGELSEIVILELTKLGYELK